MKAALFYISKDGVSLGEVGNASDLIKKARHLKSSEFPKGVDQVDVWTSDKGKRLQVRKANLILNEKLRESKTPAKKAAKKSTKK